MCGDPPNIIVGTSIGLSFFDFLTNTGLCAAICLVVSVIFLYFAFRKELASTTGEKVDISKLPKPSEAITNKKDFVISSIIFGCAVILLITHSMTHLTVASIGLFIAVITLLTSGKDAPGLLKKVDYKTLVFFIGLGKWFIARQNGDMGNNDPLNNNNSNNQFNNNSNIRDYE